MKFNELKLLDFGNHILMSGAIYSDGERDYLIYFPAEEQYSTEKLEISLEEWEQLLKQTDDVMVELDVLKDGELLKVMVRKSQRNLDQTICWKVYKRDHFSCRYCGRTGLPLTVDHIDLWEKGGITTEKNLNTSCKACNKARGNTPYPQWLTSAYYLRVSKGIPVYQRQENLDQVSTLPELELLRTTKKRDR